MPDNVYLFPVSFAQQRLWFLDRVAPGNPFYNIPLAIPIRTGLDVQSLERALNAVVARHEALRTTFRVVDGEPSQVVHSSLDIRVCVTDLRSLPPAERDSRTLDLATEEARTPFDLESGPLVRCSVLTRGAFDHVLLLTMHHIVSDGWSMGVLAGELTAFYQSFSLGYPCQLPELPIQYPDFAVWQRDWLTGATLEEQLQYWREQLDTLPVLDMPSDRPRPPVLSYKGSFHSVKLPPALSSEVRLYAAAHNATPFMVLLAAFAAVLQRYSGQDEAVIGTAIAGRNRAELEGLIGFFVNSLVLRVDVSGEPSFTELVAGVREVALGAYAHQDLPFEKLVHELNLPRDPSRNPIFQVTFQLVNTPTLTTVAASSEPSVLQVQRGSAIFDLAFTLLDMPTGFSGMFEYSTDLFDSATIERLGCHFQRLLEAALRTPEIGFRRLPLLDRDEKAEVLRWSAPARATSDGALVHRAIEEQAARTPQALAVQSEHVSLSYLDMMRNARRLATHLISLGVSRETRVGVLMDRSADMVTALLATLQAGGVYVPLDPSYPPDRLRYMVADSRAGVILTQSRYEEFAGSLADESLVLVSVDVEADAIASCPELERHVVLAPDNLAYVLYTSGSTGQPKGVAIPHGALANHMAWMLAEFPLDQTDRVLQRTPYSFDASVWEFFAPLMSGATLVVLPPDAQKNPELIVRCMADSAITVVQFVPSLLRMVLDEPGLYTCLSLRRIYCGGEALGDELRTRVLTALDVELINLYGPTEATIDSTFYKCTRASEPFGVPIGVPVSGTRAYVLDQYLEPAPFGVAGELYLAGAALARGYINQPALTAAKFLPDPFSGTPGGRMYRTGDRVRLLSDGRLLFLGRMDGQLKVRGYRIEVGEIEAAIGQVDGVRNCAVVAESSGDEAVGVIAYLVADAEEKDGPSSGDLSRFQTEHVERWQDVYQNVYRSLAPEEAAAFNFAGWTSSYTGLPIDRAEMMDWRHSTVARIRELNASRILEIGCGTGLLLTQLAPDCERFVGADFSRPVLRYLESHLSQLPGRGRQVELLHRAADNFDGFADGSFDAVILNSVVQYFPHADYLAKVLQQAFRVIAPGGCIFVGDVRSLPLLETFRLSVALHRGGRAAHAEELLSGVRTAADEEQELVIDPRFFYVLAQSLDPGGTAQVAVKRGRYMNELSRFRYDVVLRADAQATASPCQRLHWVRDQLTLDALGSLLRERPTDAVILEGVPNARVVADTTLLGSLARRGAHSRLDELIRGSEDAAARALHPEDFWQAPALRDFDVRVTFSEHPALDSVDVVVTRKGTAGLPDPAQEHLGGVAQGWSRYANNPLRGAITHRLASRIRQKLSTQLPDYMVPSAFLLLDELPLLPNGKLNRAAVPARRAVRHDDAGFIAPRTATEQAVAAVWAEVLDTPRVGIRDDFFTDLGGHSLLATQLISRIREAFCADVPLKLVFQAPTVEQFAAGLLDGPAEDRRSLENRADLLVRVGSMSETELDAALASRTSLHA